MIIKELLKIILIHKVHSIIRNLGRKQRLSLLVNLCVQHPKSKYIITSDLYSVYCWNRELGIGNWDWEIVLNNRVQESWSLLVFVGCRWIFRQSTRKSLNSKNNTVYLLQSNY